MELFTILGTRTLWFDGTNQVHPDEVPNLFLLGVPQDKIVVTELNEDIKLFNLLADEPIQLSKAENDPVNLSWIIPQEYLDLSLDEYLMKALKNRSDLNPSMYLHRLMLELVEIKKHNIVLLFKTMIYVIDRLKEEKKIWGVGRGSSCASLVLYLIGVHEVDPIKYDIPMSEFFHD